MNREIFELPWEFGNVTDAVAVAEYCAMQELAQFGYYEETPRAFDLIGTKNIAESFAGVFGRKED